MLQSPRQEGHSHLWRARLVQVLTVAALFIVQGGIQSWPRELWPFGRAQWTKKTGYTADADSVKFREQQFVVNAVEGLFDKRCQDW